MNKNVNNLRETMFQQIENIMQANTSEDLEREKLRTELLVQAIGGGIVQTCQVENEFIKITGSQGTNFVAKGYLTNEFFKDDKKKQNRITEKTEE